MIPDLERRQHGAGRNFERLHDKTSDKKRQHQGEEQGFGVFTNGRFLFFGGGRRGEQPVACLLIRQTDGTCRSLGRCFFSGHIRYLLPSPT